MSQTRTIVAAEVKAAYLAAERSAEQAAADLARCIAVMIEARRKGHFVPTLGRNALLLIGESQRLALEARLKVLDAHPLMADLPSEAGVPVGYGAEDCPPNRACAQLAAVA